VADTIAALITSKSAFMASAAAGADLDAGAKLGGDFYSKGSWKEDTAADEVIDGSASTPGNVGSYAAIAPVLRRKRVRAVVDGVEAAMGSMLSVAPTAELMNQAATYWAKRVDNVFISEITALFDASAGVLRTTHKLAKAATSGSVVKADFSSLIDAGNLLGDNSFDLSIGIVHSKVMGDLRKEAAQKANYVMFGGRPAMVIDGMIYLQSDDVPTSGSGTYKKYTSIMLRPGALWLAVQQQMREIVEINATVPETRITQTLHFACAIQGIKFTHTSAALTNAQLATATYWDKAAPVDKAIGIVALETNAS
jgi:hypothetical protein